VNILYCIINCDNIRLSKWFLPFLSSLGFEVVAEDTTNRGRIDMTLKLPDYTLISEFKVDSQESPVYQIKEICYFEKYLK
jgi:hypothetical protein